MKSSQTVKSILAIWVALWCGLLPFKARAQTVYGPFTVSGFASAIAGKTFGYCPYISPYVMGQDTTSCTRFIADWGHDGVYTPGVSVSQESRAGVQITGTVNSQISGTLQVTSRPKSGRQVDVEWLYLEYDPTPKWSIEVGRKRLPLFYYSDVQDVGYAYNMIRLNPAVYGWEITNFNGATVDYRFEIADTTVRAEALWGQERERKDPYYKIFADFATGQIPPNDQVANWKQIYGGSIDFSHDWLSGRLGYEHSKLSIQDEVAGPVQLYNGLYVAGQDFYDAALNGDPGDWVLRSEFGMANRIAYGPHSYFWSASVGHHFGKFTPTFEFGSYRETTRYPYPSNSTYPFQYTPGINKPFGVALRYDFYKNMDFKISLDRCIDSGNPPLQGTANLISAAIDMVF